MCELIPHFLEVPLFETLIGKYRNIVVSIALFLLLDASVLLLNFYISFEISDDAAGVNLAGRQRMLSQRMVKSLLDIQYAKQVNLNSQEPLDELRLTVDLFDTTFNAFDKGGEAPGAAGKSVYLEAVSDKNAVAALNQARQIWTPYKSQLDRVLNDNVDAYLESTIKYARESNLALLKLMNDLTVSLEGVASSKATRLRWIQTVGITLAIINFFIIMFHFLRQLKDSDRKLEEARKETAEILETVNEGLFLLNHDYKIGSQYSAALEDMFARKNIGGLGFEELLGEIVTSKDLSTAKRFIALLFREEIKGNLIGDLNPLSEIEVNITDEQGSFVNKYFSFSFERVYVEDKIKDVLVTVADVTERVRLERELALTKEQNDKQIEVLTSILHANPELLSVFVKDVYKSVQVINGILREPSKSSMALKRKLDEVFVEVHRIKGEASALGLDSFAEIAHDFEVNVIDLKKVEEISGDDFLALVVRLEKLVKHTESVQVLTERLSQFSQGSITGVSEVIDQGSGLHKKWQHLPDLTKAISGRCEKEVSLITSGLTEVALTEDQRALINDLSIQCIRNSIVHGIESPEERQDLNKKVTGRIDIRLSALGAGALELVIKDDGYGIDLERVREAAIKSGNWTEEQIDGWDSKRLMALIFEPGLSTSTSHSIDAGSGVGMDVIKSRVIQMRGKIRVQSRRGVGTRISVVLPAYSQAEVAA